MLDNHAEIQPAAGNDRMRIRRLTGSFGAEILGVDLSQEQDDSVWEAIRAASTEYGLIFLRDQNITEEQQIAFSRHLGEVLVGATNTPPLPDHPEILEVRKEPHQKSNVGGSWHTDQSYLENPVLRTTLLARVMPEYGGDTMFATMVGAYEALSEGMRKSLEQLNIVHSNARSMAKRLKGDSTVVDRNRPIREVIHPMVVKHPYSGRKLLYVNPGHTLRIDGWTEAESAPLLNFLYEHAKKPEFQYRLCWEVGTIAVWDNVQTWHYAINDYQGMRRVMHRTWVSRANID